MSVHEPPIERLNYYNGQRLEAGDFRAEQAYHMRVRRWLNRSLYLPGIASGLEVTKHPTDKHTVIVSAGLAIDGEGQEIILLEPREIVACGTPTGQNGIVFGNYLVISYAEAKAAALQDGCRVNAAAALPASGSSCGCGTAGGCTCGSGQSTGPGNGGLTWGGMTRVRAEPVLEFQNTWPTKASGRIVLAQLDLNAQCQVVNILSGMRQYTSESKPPKVRNVSLEGEKDIDSANSKLLYFYVSGGSPDSVTLHLWATKMSSLYYTELGGHVHNIQGTAVAVTKDLVHHHDPTGETDLGGEHTHNYYTDGGERSGGIDVNDDQVVGRTNEDASALLPAPPHGHKVTGIKLTDALDNWSHTHNLSATAVRVGNTLIDAHTAAPYSFVDSLEVWLDGQNITPNILKVLNDGSPGKWLALGDGKSTHSMAGEDGTGPIELKALGFDFSVGRHTLEFKLPVKPGGNGGQIHYNLYIE